MTLRFRGPVLPDGEARDHASAVPRLRLDLQRSADLGHPSSHQTQSEVLLLVGLVEGR